jgi:hypothetical protein
VFPELPSGTGDGEGDPSSKKNTAQGRAAAALSAETTAAAAQAPPQAQAPPELPPAQAPPPELPPPPQRTNQAAVHAPAPRLSDYPQLDKVLLSLYDIFTRDPGVNVQIQIDRYLFAASSQFVDACGGDMQMCVLHAFQAPSLFNLPDLVYILRQRLVRGSWANSMQETVCRYTIPGMQKSRWVTRQRKGPGVAARPPEPGGSASRGDDAATRNVRGRATPSTAPGAASATCNSSSSSSGSSGAPMMNQDEHGGSLTGVYINTMLGLLLGLYPRCSKRPGFTMRVRIVRAVRALLTSSVQTQTAFILDHVSLVRLAMVEYFANVLELYCPVEYNLLQNHVDVDAYVNLCRSSCDLFRVNNLSEGVQEQQHNKPLDWAMLDQLAYKMTDKIIRSTRVETKLVNYVPVHYRSIKKLVSSDIYKTPALCREFLQLVKGSAVACWHDGHSYMYQRMLVAASEASGNPQDSLVATSLDLNLVVSDIHSVLRTTMLPANFIKAQVATLKRLYGHDPIQLMVLRKKRVCLYCLLRIAPKQFVLEEKINGNIRMDLDTDEVFCNRCMSNAHVMQIDLIGRLLRINQQYLYICAECGSVHEWRGDGCDLLRCPNAQVQRLCFRAALDEETMLLNQPAKSSTGKCRTHCFMCAKLCTGNGLWLLHVASLRMIHVDLCSLHLPPPHMAQYIVDTGDYKRWLHNAVASSGTAHRKKRH